jgi:hypothetical protein
LTAARFGFAMIDLLVEPGGITAAGRPIIAPGDAGVESIVNWES